MTSQPPAPQQPSGNGRHLQIVDEACRELASSGEHFDISALHDPLNGLAKGDPADATLRALADGCAYCLVIPNSGSVGVCGPFAPMFVLRDDTSDGMRGYPRRLGDVDDDTLRLWSDLVADASLHPLLRARLADLLWVRRHKPARRWWQIAVEAYVQLADTTVESVEIGRGLQRAVAICVESNHKDLRRGPLEALERLVERTLASDKDLFGVCWRALHTLADNGHRFWDLLDAVLARYGSDPDHNAELLDIAIEASPSTDEIRRLRLEQIAAYETAAEVCTGLRRVSRLYTARQIAADGGLTQHENRLTAMIERTDMTDEWHRIEIPIEIDSEEVHSQAAKLSATMACCRLWCGSH